MSDQIVQVERIDGVLKLTLNDPKTRNALGPKMGQVLFSELDKFEQNSEDKVLLLTGQDPSFCSGANIRRFSDDIKDNLAEETRQPSDSDLPWGRMEAVLRKRKETDAMSVSVLPLRIHQLQKPTIAAVNGHAIGVGLGLALACDIRFSSEDAVFSEAFVRMGLVPGDGSCWQLPKLIGLSHTFLLQYTGDRIDSAEAYRIGLVSKVYAKNELISSAVSLATRLAQGPSLSQSLTKYLVHKSLDMSLDESLELAHAAQELARSTEDHQEAVRAFLEKRNPSFKGQ